MQRTQIVGNHRWWRAPAGVLAAILLVALASAVYVLLNRLSDEVLAILATVGCAAGVALPTSLVALAVILRRESKPAERPVQQPQMTQPVLMMVPPMQMQLPQTQPPATPATMVHQPAREFTILGDE